MKWVSEIGESRAGKVTISNGTKQEKNRTSYWFKKYQGNDGIHAKVYRIVRFAVLLQNVVFGREGRSSVFWGRRWRESSMGVNFSFSRWNQGRIDPLNEGERLFLPFSHSRQKFQRRPATI